MHDGAASTGPAARGTAIPITTNPPIWEGWSLRPMRALCGGARGNVGVGAATCSDGSQFHGGLCWCRADLSRWRRCVVYGTSSAWWRIRRGTGRQTGDVPGAGRPVRWTRHESYALFLCHGPRFPFELPRKPHADVPRRRRLSPLLKARDRALSGGEETGKIIRKSRTQRRGRVTTKT